MAKRKRGPGAKGGSLTRRQLASLEKSAHALSTMRSLGVSLPRAAREQNVSRETVLRYAGSGLRKGAGGKYVATTHDTMLRVLLLPTPEGLIEVTTRDSHTASRIGRYWNAVRHFLETGDASALSEFIGELIVDADSNEIPFLTDLHELERLGARGALSFESIYVLFR
ncbi:MAG: hypothetical protein WA728_02140 [Xanthobacteraceae bacterium]